MSDKVSITIDVTSIPRDRIVERSFTDRDGNERTVKEVKLDVVPLKQENHKTLWSGDSGTLVKTHFVCLAQTKQERADRADTVYVGDGVRFIGGQQTAPSGGNSGAMDGFDQDVPFNRMGREHDY